MKILVEIELKNIEPNDIFKVPSDWFIKSGYIDIPTNFIEHIIAEGSFDCPKYRFKYIRQIHEYDDTPRL